MERDAVKRDWNMKEFSGRTCDKCGEGEVFQKFYTLRNRNCGYCDKEILLCISCMRFHIDHSQIYPCKVCRRDIKLTEIGL